MTDFAPLQTVHTYLLVRLLNHAIWAVSSPTFMYEKLIKHLKREVRRDRNRRGIIYRPIENGVCYKIACLTIDDFYKTIAEGDEYFFEYYAADILGIFDDISEGWEVSLEVPLLSRDKDYEYAFDWYNRFNKETNVDCCASILVEEGWQALEFLARRSLRHRLYPQLRQGYALEIADRLLHDRTISSYISEALLFLAPGAEYINSRTQFVKRVRWPAFVKPLVFSRDRGKCAYCHVDIAIELLAKANVDHIIPLSKGGCNDVVNLQLCCESCNSNKKASMWSVNTSIPNYHRRLASSHKVRRSQAEKKK